MIKILIVSYFFSPANHVATHRLAAFAKYFPECGIYPIFATRHWKGDEKNWDDYFSENKSSPEIADEKSFEVIRLPYTVSNGYKFSKRQGNLAHRLYILFSALRGNLQPEMNIEKDFYEFLKEYLKENPVDYILAASAPMSTVKVASRLAKEFNIPFIADFRDMWNLAPFYIDKSKVNKRLALLNSVQEYHLKKWLKEAVLVSAINEPILEELKRLTPERAKLITVANGFEESSFVSINKNEAEKFTFSVVGTLYADQDLTILIEGLKKFLKDKKQYVQLNFIGTAAIESIRDLLSKNLPQEITNITPRVSHSEAIEILKKSHVLFYAGWKGIKGIASGKIYDYLGAGRNILIAPKDYSVLDTLMEETKAGKTADSVDEFVKILNDWFLEWKKTGKLDYYGIEEKIKFYTRENQTKILANEILKLEESKK